MTGYKTYLAATGLALLALYFLWAGDPAQALHLFGEAVGLAGLRAAVERYLGPLGISLPPVPDVPPVPPIPRIQAPMPPSLRSSQAVKLGAPVPVRGGDGSSARLAQHEPEWFARC